MRIYDIIAKKRDGNELSDEEIAYFITNYVNGEIKDYQASALLMAIYLRGMTDRETATLTLKMAESGDMLDLSAVKGIKVDKHSTGGVGDKTTLIVAPIVAALGCKVAKMSGRGLGHTGGTVDKLESVCGFNVAPTTEEFIRIVNETGICVIGQTGNLAPADKKIYALRDATATVGSIPLIASSIMSKKLAAGSDCIVLDVKYGSGAFMKTPEDAVLLSEKMVAIGKKAGKKVRAVISDMDTPLGKNIGNSLEVIEAADILKNGTECDLKEVSTELAANILILALGFDYNTAKEKVLSALSSGAAYKKFLEMISAQGGDISLIENTERFEKAKHVKKIFAPADGYIEKTDAEKIGCASVILGAGRLSKEDTVDYTAGIILHKKSGDRVSAKEMIAELFTNDEGSLENASELFLSGYSFSEKAPDKTKKLIYKVIE